MGRVDFSDNISAIANEIGQLMYEKSVGAIEESFQDALKNVKFDLKLNNKNFKVDTNTAKQVIENSFKKTFSDIDIFKYISLNKSDAIKEMERLMDDIDSDVDITQKRFVSLYSMSKAKGFFNGKPSAMQEEIDDYYEDIINQLNIDVNGNVGKSVSELSKSLRTLSTATNNFIQRLAQEAEHAENNIITIATEQGYEHIDVSKAPNYAKKRLQEVANKSKTPVWHAGDLSPYVMTSGNYQPGDNLRFQLEKNRFSSVGSGVFYGSGLDDIMHWISEKVEERFDKGFDTRLYFQDLSKFQDSMFAPLNDDEGAGYYGGFLENISTFIANLVNPSETLKKRLGDIDSIDSLYNVGKDYFEKFNVTIQGLQSFINEEAARLKEFKNQDGSWNLDVVATQPSITTQIQKRLLGLSGFDATKTIMDDSVAVGSVVFDADYKNGFDIDFGKNTELANWFNSLVIEKALYAKAKQFTDPDELEDLLYQFAPDLEKLNPSMKKAIESNIRTRSFKSVVSLDSESIADIPTVPNVDTYKEQTAAVEELTETIEELHKVEEDTPSSADSVSTESIVEEAKAVSTEIDNIKESEQSLIETQKQLNEELSQTPKALTAEELAAKKAAVDQRNAEAALAKDYNPKKGYTPNAEKQNARNNFDAAEKKLTAKMKDENASDLSKNTALFEYLSYMSAARKAGVGEEFFKNKLINNNLLDTDVFNSFLKQTYDVLKGNADGTGYTKNIRKTIESIKEEIDAVKQLEDAKVEETEVATEASDKEIKKQEEKTASTQKAVNKNVSKKDTRDKLNNLYDRLSYAEYNSKTDISKLDSSDLSLLKEYINTYRQAVDIGVDKRFINNRTLDFPFLQDSQASATVLQLINDELEKRNNIQKESIDIENKLADVTNEVVEATKKEVETTVESPLEENINNEISSKVYNKNADGITEEEFTEELNSINEELNSFGERLKRIDEFYDAVNDILSKREAGEIDDDEYYDALNDILSKTEAEEIDTRENLDGEIKNIDNLNNAIEKVSQVTENKIEALNKDLPSNGDKKVGGNSFPTGEANSPNSNNPQSSDNNDKLIEKYKRLTELSKQYYDNLYGDTTETTHLTQQQIKEIEELTQAYEELNKVVIDVNESKSSQDNAKKVIDEFKSSMDIENGRRVLIDELNKASNGIGFKDTFKLSPDFTAKVNDLSVEIAHLYEQINKVDSADGFKQLAEDIEKAKAKAKQFSQTYKNEILSSLGDGSAGGKKLQSLSNRIESYITLNPRIPKQFKSELDKIYAAINDGGAKSGSEIQNLSDRFDELKLSIRKAGKEGQGFFGLFKSRISYQIANGLARYFSFQDVMRYARQGFEVIQELDTALVDLRKTSSMSLGQINEFYKDANDSAKQLGVTTKEIIQLAADWSRLGYSDKASATTMAQLTSQFASISPGMGTDAAQEGLVSIMKAFDIEANEVESRIMDKINILGNNFAETNNDIIEGMKRAGATLAALGESEVNSFALFTGAQEIIQNAETVGTALKTLSLRIKGYDEETEEFSQDVFEATGKVADLTKTASKPMGISLFTDASQTEYKSLVQYLGEISEIWDELDAKVKTDLLEKLFGKRGASVGAAILGNFDAVEGALKTMENSAGSADREMEIIEQSIEYKLNHLKETWVGVAQDLIDRGDIGKLIDGLTGISEILSKITSLTGLPGILGGAVGITAGIKGFNFKNILTAPRIANQDNQFLTGFEKLDLTTNTLDNLKASIIGNSEAIRDNLSPELQNLVKDWEDNKISTEVFRDGIVNASKTGTAAMTSLTTATTVLKNVFTNLAITAAISLAITAVSKYIDYVMHHSENIKNAAKEATDQYKESEDTIVSIKDQLESQNSEMKTLLGYGEELTSEEQDRLSELQKTTKELEYQLELERERVRLAARNAVDKGMDYYDDKYKMTMDTGTDVYTAESLYKMVVSEEDNTIKALRERIDGIKADAEAGKLDDDYDYQAAIRELEHEIQQKKDEAISTFEEFVADYKSEFIDEYADINIGWLDKDQQQWILDRQKEYDEMMLLLNPNYMDDKNLTSIISGDYLKNLKTLAKVNKNGALTVEALEESYPELVGQLKRFNLTSKDACNYVNALIRTEKQLVVENEAAANTYSGFLERVEKSTAQRDSVLSYLSSVSSGKSISFSDFTSENLKEYGKFLENVNGSLQLNQRAVYDALKAQAEAEILQNDALKQDKYSEYTKNSVLIAKYTKALGDLDKVLVDGNVISQNTIDALKAENDKIEWECDSIEVYNQALREQLGLYAELALAQSTDDTNYYEQTYTTAIDNIDKAWNDPKSDLYFRFGRDDYLTSLKVLNIPDEISPDDKDAIMSYLDSAESWLVEIADGVKILDYNRFLNETMAAGLMTQVDNDNDGILEWAINGEHTMQEFADTMGWTIEFVEMMFEDLNSRGFKFTFADEDVTQLRQKITDAYTEAMSATDEETKQAALNNFQTYADEISRLTKEQRLSMGFDVEDGDASGVMTVIEKEWKDAELKTEPIVQIDPALHEINTLQSKEQNIKNKIEDPMTPKLEITNYLKSLGDMETAAIKTRNQIQQQLGGHSGGINIASAMAISGGGLATGTFSYSSVTRGTAFVNGTAKLKGDWGASSGERVLIGELG